MRILGIDPGFATIGFGLVEAERGQVQMRTYGTITTPAGLPLSRRLYQIDCDMVELIGQLKPEVIAIEELFFNTNITTGIAVAHGRGVILCAAERCGISLYEYTPSQVKLSVTKRYLKASADRECEGNNLTVKKVGTRCFIIWMVWWRKFCPIWP